MLQPEQMTKLASAYAAHAGIALSTVGERVCGNNKLFRRLAAGKGCNSSTLQRAGTWFAANWPAGLDWPQGLERPALEIAMIRAGETREAA